MSETALIAGGSIFCLIAGIALGMILVLPNYNAVDEALDIALSVMDCDQLDKYEKLLDDGKSSRTPALKILKECDDK